MVCGGNVKVAQVMLAGHFLLPSQEGDEHKKDKKPLARFSFKRVCF